MKTPDGTADLTFRITPNGMCELEESFEYSNLKELLDNGSLIPDGWVPVREEKPVINVTETVEVHEDEPLLETVDEPIIEDNHDEITPEGVKFICDICGAECATERGLSRHKSSKHPENL